MIRLIAQAMTSLALIFWLALGVIRAQPYDDGGLSAQLASEDCGCFLGIRPGETTKLQALLLLHTNPWVGTVTMLDNQTIRWAWNGQQPAFLSKESARLTLANGVVSEISVPTSARLADLAFDFGVPDPAYYFTWQVRDSSTLVLNYFDERAAYYDDQFEATASALCPLTNVHLWALPVTLTFPAPAAHSSLMGVVRNAFAPIDRAC